MEVKEHRTKVFGQECTLNLIHFTKDADGKEWKRIFDLWRNLKLGLRGYKAREPNFPEGLSEVAFCLWSGSGRYLKIKGSKKAIAASFDTFNFKECRAEQIKACSVDGDLTSFGPKSKWDDLYFLDFYNGGEVNGLFDIYKIPDDLIYGMKVNKSQTLKDQQVERRRPRFSIKKDIIAKNSIQPIAQNVKVW